MLKYVAGDWVKVKSIRDIRLTFRWRQDWKVYVCENGGTFGLEYLESIGDNIFKIVDIDFNYTPWPYYTQNPYIVLNDDIIDTCINKELMELLYG